MSEYAVNEIRHERGAVVVGARHWDGIDRPDYLSLERMTPDVARHWAQQILDKADEAETYLSKEKASSLANKKAELERLKSEVQQLETEIAA